MSFVIDDYFPEENCWVNITFQTLAEHREKEKPKKNNNNNKKVPVKNFDVMEKVLLEVPIETYVFFSGKIRRQWWKDEIRSLCCMILAAVLSAAYFFT